MSESDRPLKRSLLDSVNLKEFLDGSTRVSENLRNVSVGLGTYKPGWR